MIIERIVKKILDAQSEIASAIVQHPTDSLHKYHNLAGVHLGLARALEIIQEEMRDIEDRD